MADYLDALRRAEHFDALMRLLHPEMPLVERKNPFHVYDDAEFIYRFRFSKQTAIQLIQDMTPALGRHTTRSDALPVYVQVLAALRFYAVGSFQILHGDESGVSQSSLSKIIVDVSTHIAQWRDRYIRFPNTREEILTTQEQFFNYCNFPGVIGAIDCTHVPIKNPGGENAQRFINRKQRSSINVQAVCNMKGLITNLVARWPGGSHDSRIFNESALKDTLDSESNEAKWLLGDSGYACQPYLMTPLLNPNGREELRYNRAHIRGRNIIERLFGMWKRRFPCLNGLRLKLDTILATIVAVGVLWNISVLRNEPIVEGPDGPIIPGNQRPPHGVHNVAGPLRRQRIIEENFSN